MRKSPTMIGFDTNLTRVLMDKEEKLKTKYGKAYRNPHQRMIDGMAGPIMSENNKCFTDLECILG